MSAETGFGADGPRRRRSQTTPPDGLLPGQMTTVLGYDVDRLSVVATIVDLAMRGHLVICEGVKRSGRSGRGSTVQWDVVVVDDDVTGLSLFEDVVVGSISHHGGRAPAAAFMSPTWATTARRWIRQDVVDRGWATGISHRRWRMSGGAALMTFGGALLGEMAFDAVLLLGTPDGEPLLTATDRAVLLPALGLVLTGLVMWRTGKGVSPVPAEVAEAAARFRHHLENADAEELERTHGIEVLAAYAPWAIALGLVEQWARVLTACSERGLRVPEQHWYLTDVPEDSSSTNARLLALRLEAFTTALVGPSAGWELADQPGSGLAGAWGGFSEGGGFGGGGGGGGEGGGGGGGGGG